MKEDAGRRKPPPFVSIRLMATNPWYVLTGAPSSGKSTLLNELSGRGYKTVKEAARYEIERQVAAGEDFQKLRANASEFQHRVLRLKLEWEAKLPKDEVVFFDRGIPDSVAYYINEGIPEDEFLHDALQKCSYRKIFILDLISKENFIHDGARSETWEGAVELDALLETAYRNLGYQVERVPVMSVAERADFVLVRLD